MKVYIQVIDTNTGVYQTGMIDEPVLLGSEVKNALLHFGVNYGHIKWHSQNKLSNISDSFGEVENTSKVVTVVTID